MKAQIKAGARQAEKLTTVGIKVRIKDACTDLETVTTSLPWQLGHGEWVVQVQGKSGGWSCAMLTVLAESPGELFVGTGTDSMEGGAS